MDPLIITTLITLALKIADMAENWNNKDYQPPSADELRALAKQLESLPDLPVK